MSKLSHVTRMKELCHVYKLVSTAKESYHDYGHYAIHLEAAQTKVEQVSHVTRMNESCRTHE